MNQTTPETSSDQNWQKTVSLWNYLLVLAAWWREIALGSVAVAVVAGGTSLALRILLPQYKTSADVAIIPLTTSVSLDDTLRTGGVIDPRPRSREMAARRAALVGLVLNGNVARDVVEQLKESLDEDETNPAFLLTKIESELVTLGVLSRENHSDLIRIWAHATSPKKAAALATVWAEQYVEHINQLYQQAPESVFRGVADELKKAQATYDTVQKELETFIASNDRATLERKISTRRETINSLQQLWSKTLAHRLIENEKKEEIRTLHFGVANEALKEKMKTDYALYEKMIRLLNNASDLRLHIKRSGEAGVSSNGLALLLLKAATYADTSELAQGLEIDLDDLRMLSDSADAQLGDVEALIATIQARIKDLERSIPESHAATMKDSNSSENGRSPWGVFDSPSSQQTPESGMSGKTLSDQAGSVRQALRTVLPELASLFGSLESEIQTLEAKHLEASTKLANLTQERDRRNSALQSLKNEMIELTLTKASATAQVRLAEQAMAPLHSVYPSPTLLSVLGGIAGLLVTAFFALSLNSAGKRPFLEKPGSA